MLPLAADTTPTSVPELTEAIRRGLQKHGVEPRSIDASGDNLSAIQSLRIDLSGAALNRDIRPPKTGGGGTPVEIAQFDLLGAPVHFEKAPIELRLTAAGAKAEFAIADGQGTLELKSAASGNVSVTIARQALEALLHSFAVEAAARQGFEVRKTTLNFTQEGPRTVTFRAEVTAKVFVMSASLALTGRLAVDDALNARLSNLALDGDGMILKLAGSFAKPHLDRLEGREFALMTFAPAGLRLRDVQMTAGEALHIRAEFA